MPTLESWFASEYILVPAALESIARSVTYEPYILGEPDKPRALPDEIPVHMSGEE